MTSLTGTGTVEAAPGRHVRPFGAFSAGLVALEVRRVLRNRRAALFSVVLPVVLFLAFGLNSAYADQRAGSGNVSAYVMISMALYGCVVATTSGGAAVSLERAAGWSRQLRLTPLSPVAYVAVKMTASLAVGLLADLAVYATGLAVGKPHMPASVWAISALAVWLGSLLFGAFGLFMGYLLPADNVMQVLGFVLWLLSFCGGLFIPLNQAPALVRHLAAYTPLFGLNNLVHYDLSGGAFDWTWAVNVACWMVVFVGGATWRFRRDTARV